jgi:hypothetical protein
MFFIDTCPLFCPYGKSSCNRGEMVSKSQLDLLVRKFEFTGWTPANHLGIRQLSRQR